MLNKTQMKIARVAKLLMSEGLGIHESIRMVGEMHEPFYREIEFSTMSESANQIFEELQKRQNQNYLEGLK